MTNSSVVVLEKRTYTPSEVAEILGVSIRKVYYICKDTTDFKVMRLGKGCIRIHKPSFDKWLDEMEDN